MGFKYSFEKLEVWQLSKLLTKKIYVVTTNFPEEEKFGIISQIRRAAVSVTCNLAEGSGRKTGKDKAHFTQIAFSSLLEVLNLLIVSVELGFLKVEEYSELRREIEEMGNKINALRNAQLKISGCKNLIKPNKQILK
ncbi:MAG: four helix bundle protein [Bacteroidota bacterium]